MDKESAYARAIEILFESTFDARRLAFQLAKEDPILFVSLVGGDNVAPWMHEALAYLKSCKMIQCIKIIRANTGFGLKESKDIAVKLDNILHDQGYPEYPARRPEEPLDSQQTSIYDIMASVLKRG